MSEPLTEEEKQRLRIDIMAEMAKNEQDPEQCNEETGRYNRKFLYNVRDLEQICSITECPLTSLQLKEFGITAKKKKNVFAKWWKRLKDWLMKRQKIDKTAGKKDYERMKVEKEERCLNEEEVFPFIALPKELQYQIYPHFDLEARRALRIIEELEKIEMNTKYRYKSLTVRIMEELVILGAYNNNDILVTSSCFVPHSELEKELEIMGKNTQFDELYFASDVSDSLQIMNVLQSVKLSEICISHTPSFNDSELQSIVQNREQVWIHDLSAITVNGLFWIYEKMRDRQLDLNYAIVEISETIRWDFLDKFGTFDRETLEFVGTNPNQTFLHCTGFECIDEGALKMYVDLRDMDGKIGDVTFKHRSD